MSLNVYDHDGLIKASYMLLEDAQAIHKESLAAPKLSLETLKSLTERIKKCKEMITALGEQINQAMLNIKAFGLNVWKFVHFANMYGEITKTNFFLLGLAERDVSQQISNRPRKHVTFAPNTKE